MESTTLPRPLGALTPSADSTGAEPARMTVQLAELARGSASAFSFGAVARPRVTETLPLPWDFAGAPALKIEWLGATGGGCRWEATLAPLDGPQSAPVTVVTAAVGGHLVTTMLAFPADSVLTAGMPVTLSLVRDTASAEDTLAGAVQLVSVRLDYLPEA